MWLDILFNIFLNLHKFADFIKIINQDYSNFLSALAGIFSALGSFLLLFVTMIYVIFTYKQVNIAKESIDLNKEYLKQSERQHKTSVVPILEPIEIKVHGGACYPTFNGSMNRKLFVFWNMKNTGNSPAIQIYNKIEFKLKFVEGDSHIFTSRYRYAGSLTTNDKRDASAEFDIDKLSLLLADIIAMLKYNTDVLEKGLGEGLARGATLAVNCVFTNVYDQYFKTVYEGEIYNITVKDKNGQKRNLYKLDEQMLKNDEEFDLIIPFYRLKFSLLNDVEKKEFIKELANSD